MLRALAVLLACTPALTAQSDPATGERAVVAAYAELAHHAYGAAVRGAEALQTAIDAFVAAPSEATLRAARTAWIDARSAYGPTEVFRFYGGPIDDPHHGVERYVNAWPIDEAFLDGVRGRPDAGIIQAPERYPVLTGPVLVLLDERGGETHVTTGWHAIEFLLWGQDFDPAGPGARPALDYVPGKRPFAARRGTYLRAVAARLAAHLRQVRDAWAAGQGGYRDAFENATPRDSLRKILTGMVVLSGFEMSGERLAVAYETRDQEDEHSCFSDTTHLDLRYDQRGITAVWNGRSGRPGLREVARAVAPALAGELDRALRDTATRLAAIPPPFDQAILGADDGPGRRAVLAAIEALEHQAQLLVELGLALHVRVPMRPGS